MNNHSGSLKVGTGTARLTHVDVAKGIGILLTLLGHCLAYSGLVRTRVFAVIYSFHMPFFFFLSGYMFKRKAPATFFSDKIKSLLIPAIIYQSINLLMYVLFFVSELGDYYTFFSFGGFWFILTLLYVSVLYYAVDLVTEKINNMRTKQVARILSAVILLFVGLIYATRISDQHNQPIATSFVGYFYYVLGQYTKIWEQKKQKRDIPKPIYGTIGIILLAVLAMTIRLNNRTVDMNTSRYGIQWVFVVHSLLGITGTYLISKMIIKNRILEFFGRNSLIVLLIHIPISKAVPTVMGYWGILSWYRLLFSTALALVGSFVAIKLFEKKMRFMTGKIEWDKLYGE